MRYYIENQYAMASAGTPRASTLSSPSEKVFQLSHARQNQRRTLKT
jgi:hypothetical protein